MLLTPLYVRALNLCEQKKYTFCTYKPIIYWDPECCQVTIETRKYHIFLWLFTNFGLIGGVALTCLAGFIFQYLNDHNYSTILDFLFACLQVCVASTIVLTAWAYLKWASEIATFYNQIVRFEVRLERKYCKIKVISSKLFLPNGKLDVLGILTSLVFVVLIICVLFGPGVIVWLELDFMILPFKRTLSDSSFLSRVIFHLFRVIVVEWALIEAARSVRTFSNIFLLVFRGLDGVLQILVSRPLSAMMLNELAKLRILFALIRDSVSFLLFVYLAALHVGMVLIATLTVAGVKDFPWQLQFFFVLAWLMGVVVAMTLLNFVVTVDSISARLQWKWISYKSSAGCKWKSAWMRLLTKRMRSVKRLVIPVGDASEFSKASRTRYLGSGMEMSMNFILAFR